MTVSQASLRLKDLLHARSIYVVRRGSYAVAGSGVEYVPKKVDRPAKPIFATRAEITILNKKKIADALSGNPCRVRELNFIFEGEFSDSRIRELLKLLEADGVIHRDDAYVWHLTGEEMSDAA